MSLRRVILGCAVLALVASCGSNKLNKDTSPLAAGISQIGQMIKLRKAGGAAAVQGDAAEKLRGFAADAKGAVIIGAVEEAQLPIVIEPLSENGPYTTWGSPDKRTITMVSGVISATRGYGGDVLGYDARPTAAAITGRKVAEYSRTMRFLGPQYELRGATLKCVTENQGTEDITIIDTARKLVHMVEACTDQGGGTVKSEYWVDGSGVIWQSRQWIGPQLGFVFMQRVK